MIAAVLHTVGVEVGNDSKRPRTDTDTVSASASTKEEDSTNTSNTSQVVSLDNINSTSESNNAVTASNNDDDEEEEEEEDGQNKELPTPVELSQELCKLVSDRYSRDESLRALKNIYNWVTTEDADFYKLFYIYGGVVRVVDFLKATMNDIHCKGTNTNEMDPKRSRCYCADCI